MTVRGFRSLGWTVVIFVIGIMVLFAFLKASRTEVSSATYSTYKEAMDAGAIDRGWVPDFIPANSSQILEEHNIDTNTVTVEFSFDENSLRQTLKRFKPTKTPGRNDISLPTNSSIDLNGPLVSYAPVEGGVLVVNFDQRRALYWFK